MESQQGLSIGSLLDDPPMMTAPSLEKQTVSMVRVVVIDCLVVTRDIARLVSCWQAGRLAA
jgi:hypothetical protein